MIEQFCLTSRCDPKRYYHYRAGWTWRLLAMKMYATFPKAPEVEPHHQMQFSIILNTFVWLWYYLTHNWKNKEVQYFFEDIGLKVNIRGEFNKFPAFFVQVFKIVVDSWTFSMLLLYILWDDWPIFMISASNEQIQQQLEYTLLKPDCHSWWISKMQSGRQDTLEERTAIKLCFKLRKNAAETYGMLQTAFRPSCVNRPSAFEWHKKFKEGSESMMDDERCGRSKEVNRTDLIGQTFRVRVTMLRF